MTSRRQYGGVGVLLVSLSVAMSSCVADGQRGDVRAQSLPPSDTTSSNPTPCPAGATVEKWPGVVPQLMPVPPGLGVISTRPEGASIVVRFAATQSIKEASVFLARRLPAAGFTLHGGDSEENEVDQPFTGYGVRGTFKLRDNGPCLLQGILVISPLA